MYNLRKLTKYFCVFSSILITSHNVLAQAEIKKGIQLGYCAYDYITDEAIEWYAEHADLLIIHEWQKDKMKAIKAISPDITILLYKISINKSDDSHGAHDFVWVNQNHPEWFLVDKDGRRMTDLYNEYSKENVYWMDWGNQAWEDYWCNSVLNDSISQGWDGIFMDCAFVDIQDYWAPSGILKYSTDSEFNIAMESFISGCYSQAQAAGKLFLPNSVDCVYHDGCWESKLAHSHGGVEEGFVNIYWWNPERIWRTEERWERQISALEHTGEQNKMYYAMAHNRGLNRQDTLYNVASYLIGKKNSKAFFFNEGVKGNVYNNYVRDYNMFRDIYTAPIGSPTGKRYKYNNIWLRNYTGGKVMVNPTSNSYSVLLDTHYEQLDGTQVSSVTLKGHEGIILLLDTIPPAQPSGLRVVP